eukprot:TRINITY_DN55119_c0_g1_i1.p1 TRINITY_DN55119_c0_g1~~TRINITY_DN55119_c0_g1_i1.p1  ORF type:complete len:383 (-),score=112.40 TRINITY_DN55119_c0_g1_i1:63-1211(-)
MGSGASAEVHETLSAASGDHLVAFISELPADSKEKLKTALAVGGATGSDAGGPDDIPKEWGWPAEPFEPEDLRLYVLEATKPTVQEQWDEALEARAIDSKKEDFIAEKAFANLLLNKEGTGEERTGGVYDGIDPRAYTKGKWYRFLNHKGDCNVYIHNYTRHITATRPANFAELTEEEKKFLRTLGVYLKELPAEIEKVYQNEKAIPIIFGSPDTCEAFKVFCQYDKNCTLLDATKLKRVNAGALEDCRKAMVNAMKLGTTLCVYCGDILPEFLEKICISKYRDTLPLSLFMYDGLSNDMVRERVYRDEEKEGGQCVLRPGFQVCIMVSYDTLELQLSSYKKADLPSKFPEFERMKEVRCYNDDDKKKALEALRAGKKDKTE